MLVTPIKTYRIRYYEQPSLEEVVCECLPIHQDGIILAVTAKIVSLCEGSFVYKEAPNDGIAVLPPADASYTAGRIHRFLLSHYRLKNAGVIIVDPNSKNGVLLAQSGFTVHSDQHDDLFNLAAAAAATMGKNKTTPLALVTNVPFARFVRPKAKMKLAPSTVLQ